MWKLVKIFRAYFLEPRETPSQSRSTSRNQTEFAKRERQSNLERRYGNCRDVQLSHCSRTNLVVMSRVHFDGVHFDSSIFKSLNWRRWIYYSIGNSFKLHQINPS